MTNQKKPSGVDRLDLGCAGHAPDDHVAIMWVELDAVAAPAGLRGGDQRGTAAGEGVKHDAPTPGAVENRIGDEGERLDRGV